MEDKLLEMESLNPAPEEPLAEETSGGKKGGKKGKDTVIDVGESNFMTQFLCGGGCGEGYDGDDPSQH